MIRDSEKRGFKVIVRPLRPDEVIPLYLPQAALIFSIVEQGLADTRRKRDALAWKNKLNAESRERLNEKANLDKR